MSTDEPIYATGDNERNFYFKPVPFQVLFFYDIAFTSRAQRTTYFKRQIDSSVPILPYSPHWLYSIAR